MTVPSPRRNATLTLTLALLGATLAGCGSGDGSAHPGGDHAASDQLTLVTGFYPLEYLTTRIAGEHAEVSTLTAPGVDPHDVELSPRTVGTLSTADLVIYAAGMQAAVDEAVRTQAEGHSLDVTPAADLLTVDTHDDHDGDHDHNHDDHNDHDQDDHDYDEHHHGPVDLHFWLDTERYGQVAEAIADRLVELDPAHEQTYRDNTATLIDELATLDEEYVTGLAQCESHDLVATHEAFGYLAERYGLNQIGITGMSPVAEPSPARLAEVSSQVRDLGVSTIYAEPILTSRIAETVARETGARVLVLDPVEGITDSSAAQDYLGVMRANLESLRDGLGCA